MTVESRGRPGQRWGLQLALLLGLGLLTAFGHGQESGPARGLDLGAFVAGDADAAEAAGYAVARAPKAFDFPRDHGPHPDYRTEWWYLVTHLEDADGRRFAAQFTLFRQALAPPGVEVRTSDASRWRTRQVWMAHVALTAPEHGHQASERFARGELGLAGVTASPFRAWLEDWELSSGQTDTLFPLQLQASVSDVDAPFLLDLRFDDARGPILQGEDGFSQKSERAGNASYYFSFTRMQVEGSVEIGGERYQVSGLGWKDREWSTSVLDEHQTGWDWFALHLDDGRDLMLFQVRGSGLSSQDETANGSMLVSSEGTYRVLAPEGWSLEPLHTWRDETGADWPVSWRLEVPAEQISGTVTAWQPDQLNRLSMRYWEGPVDLVGNVNGRGFLEMTGYAR